MLFFFNSFRNGFLYKLYALPLYCIFVSSIFLVLFTNNFLTYPYDILCKEEIYFVTAAISFYY